MTLVGLGVILLFSVWLAGALASDMSARTALAPHPGRPGIAYGVAGGLFLSAALVEPTAQTTRAPVMLVAALDPRLRGRGAPPSGRPRGPVAPAPPPRIYATELASDPWPGARAGTARSTRAARPPARAGRAHRRGVRGREGPDSSIPGAGSAPAPERSWTATVVGLAGIDRHPSRRRRRRDHRARARSEPRSRRWACSARSSSGGIFIALGWVIDRRRAAAREDLTAGRPALWRRALRALPGAVAMPTEQPPVSVRLRSRTTSCSPLAVRRAARLRPRADPARVDPGPRGLVARRGASRRPSSRRASTRRSRTPGRRRPPPGRSRLRADLDGERDDRLGAVRLPRCLGQRG